MSVLYLVFIKIVVAVALGFILRKNRIIDERMQKGLSDMLLKAILPFSILASANYEKSPEVARGMLATLVAAIVYYAVTLVVMTAISKKLNFQDKEKRVFVTMTTFANTGFVGFPIMSALYGDQGLHVYLRHPPSEREEGRSEGTSVSACKSGIHCGDCHFYLSCYLQ